MLLNNLSIIREYYDHSQSIYYQKYPMFEAIKQTVSRYRYLYPSHARSGQSSAYLSICLNSLHLSPNLFVCFFFYLPTYQPLATDRITNFVLRCKSTDSDRDVWFISRQGSSVCSVSSSSYPANDRLFIVRCSSNETFDFFTILRRTETSPLSLFFETIIVST